MTRLGFSRLSLCLAGVHFLASLAIVPLTLAAGRLLPSGMSKTLLTGGLVAATKALYFPILSLALYPRVWFPGLWIYAPVAANSLLWGLLVAAGIILVRRWWRPRRP